MTDVATKSSITIKPIRDDLSFGVRIDGVTFETLKSESVRKQILDAFKSEGMIIFENVEPSSEMQLAISDVFGPLKEHPVKSVSRVNDNTMPGVIEIKTEPGNGLIEMDGEEISNWLPWHFDHCYNDELNLAGVLRCIRKSEAGGLTGFMDGVALYKTLPKELLAKIEGKEILYTLNTGYARMKFGVPDNFKELRPKNGTAKTDEIAKTLPRAIHPAVWTTELGEKTLHVSPWMAEGIVGMENDEGDALLEEVCKAINASDQFYRHDWKPTDMLIWDNTRMLHSVSGMPPDNSRTMHRTTIRGDYGLGRFENDAAGDKILSDTMV